LAEEFWITSDAGEHSIYSIKEGGLEPNSDDREAGGEAGVQAGEWERRLGT